MESTGFWSQLRDRFGVTEAEAHCDGPCGVYDPASARIAAEAVLSVTKKIKALTPPSPTEATAWLAFQNTFGRYVAIKEQQAEIAKRELLVLWTDYFKPDHLKANPNLHETFWKAAKLCSTTKQELNEDAANKLLEAIREIHDIFWKAKGRTVAWYNAA